MCSGDVHLLTGVAGEDDCSRRRCAAATGVGEEDDRSRRRCAAALHSNNLQIDLNLIAYKY